MKPIVNLFSILVLALVAPLSHAQFVTLGAAGDGDCDYTLATHSLQDLVDTGAAIIRLAGSQPFAGAELSGQVSIIGGHQDCADAAAGKVTTRTGISGEPAFRVNRADALVSIANLELAAQVSVLGNGVEQTLVIMDNVKLSGVPISAVQVHDATIRIENSIIASNSAGNGGGLLCQSGSATLVRTILEDNRAVGSEGRGGALWLDDCDLFIAQGRFTGNRADGHGGAIFARNGSDVLLTDGEDLASLLPGVRAPVLFEGNDADSNNDSVGDGGAVYVENAEVLGSGLRLVGNSGVNGGAIAAGAGGVVSLVQDEAGCWRPGSCNELVGNQASDFGGALASLGGAVTIRNAVLRSNSQFDAAVAFATNGGALSLYQSVISDHNGVRGLIQEVPGSQVILGGVTIARNDASRLLTGAISVHNAILYNPETPDVANTSISGSCIVTNDADIASQATGVVVTNAPGFLDYAGGDFRLGPDSVARDLCSTLVANTSRYDIDGDDLVLLKLGEVDAGADEYTGIILDQVAVGTDEDTDLTAGFGATHAEGNALAFYIDSQPSQGSVINNANDTFTFDPGFDFQSLAAGESTTVSFDFTAADGETAARGTITIEVTGVNDAPLAGPIAAVTTEDTAVTGAFNVSEIDSNDVLTFAIVAPPHRGTISIDQAAGRLTFDPSGEFEQLADGQFDEVGFTYSVSDGSVTAQGTGSVQIAGRNDAPVAAGDSYVAAANETFSTDRAVGVLANDVDVDGDMLSVTKSRLVSGIGGALAVNDDGSFSYTPPADTTGIAIFEYTVSDGLAADAAQVTITVAEDETADLQIAISDGVDVIFPDAVLTYRIDVLNAGPADVLGAMVEDLLPPELGNATWTCTPTAGASCAKPSGSGDIRELVDLPAGDAVVFELTTTVTDAFFPVTNVATVTLPAGVTDSIPANNMAGDTNAPDMLFGNGFEGLSAAKAFSTRMGTLDTALLNVVPDNGHAVLVLRAMDPGTENQGLAVAHARRIEGRLGIRVSRLENGTWVVGEWTPVTGRVVELHW